MSRTRGGLRRTRRARRARPVQRRGLGRSSWVGATILIAAGLLLLLQDVSAFNLGRWWALLFLIPAAAAGVSAWNAYRAKQQEQALVSLAGGLLSLMLALVFLLEMSIPWTYLWPLLLMAAGGLLLLRQAPLRH